MMLDSIRVQRFKSLTDVTLEFGPRLTVLVGPNNAGKSSLLQAIQFGVSVAQSVQLEGTARWAGNAISGTLAADQLIYAPLRDIQTLAQGGALRQATESAIALEYRAGDEVAEVSVRRGKNKNISVRCEGKVLGKSLENVRSPFSVIAPGLAGIPAFEEFRSEGIVRRAAARGDANSVFRNVLWILRNAPADWDLFQSRLHEVFPDATVDVTFDPSSDEHLRATVTRAGTTLPIDASGTGILQAAQVLAYVGVYAPRLLILDEPDAHLHPDNQRKLVRILDTLAEEADMRVLMSTHSRHMLDESVAIGARLHWVSSGEINDADFDVVDALMALGALDVGDRLRNGTTEWVVLTEDSDTKMIETLLQANGFNAASMSVWSYAGCSQIGAAQALGRFIVESAPGTKIIVHRDRDFLEEEELQLEVGKLQLAGLHVLTTPGTDMESYFLDSDHVAAVYSDVDRAAIEALIADATNEGADDSVAALTNARLAQAYKKRKDGEGQPDAGRIALQARSSFDADPARFRHGKKTIKRINRLAQERLGKARDLVTPTNALAGVEVVAPR